MTFPHEDNPEHTELSEDRVVFTLISAENTGIGREEKLGVGVDVYVQIDGDIDRYHNELKDKGVRIVVDIKGQPYRMRDSTVEAINGYKLASNQTR